MAEESFQDFEKRWNKLGKGLQRALKVKKGDKNAISETLAKYYPKIYGKK
tara:strand:- start:330 stop:479 length:150 start_codon:yes stop_codon:yes gene_type:complete